MRRLFVLVLAVLAVATCWAQRLKYEPCLAGSVDVRASYLVNAAQDVGQTTQFPRFSARELNPLPEYFLKRGTGTFTAAGIGSILLFDSWANRQPKNQRRDLYTLATIVEALAVLNNRSLVGNRGFPILVVRFKS